MKNILLISTGGTIGSSNSEQGLMPLLTYKEILAKVPNIDIDTKVHGLQLMNIDSGNINPNHWLKIVNEIKNKYEDFDGFVITHGTDTLSYTSAALSYLIQNPKKPIVLTGSQTPISFEGTDAVSNLSRSIALASYGVGGVFIVFDNKAILGTEARKVKSKSDDAFISLNIPYLACFEDDTINWNNKVLEKLKQNKKPAKFYEKLNSNVALVKLAPGLKPDLLLYLAEHYDAIVIEAYGVGSIPFDEDNNFLDAVEHVTKNNCIVLVVSQALNQGTFMYKYEISRKALNVEYVLEGGLLSTECAVTKLMWALGVSNDRNEVRKMINTPILLDKVKAEDI